MSVRTSSSHSDEEINTGITELDAVETAFANAITVGLVAGGTKETSLLVKLLLAELQMSLLKLSLGIVLQELLSLLIVLQTFTIPETITGGSSSASWTTASYNTINNHKQ